LIAVPAVIRTRFATLAALELLMFGAPRHVASAPNNAITFEEVQSKWTVAPDGTWMVDAEVTLRAPGDNPSGVVRMPISWSASVETLSIVQARIDKPDGHQIILPKNAIREDPPTGDQYFHEFSDQHRLLITFSGIDPGDLLIVHTKRTVIHPRVPGGFMAAPVLDRGVEWEETDYSISVPDVLPFHYETRGFDHQSETIRDRIVHYFHSPRVGLQTGSVSTLGPFDQRPRFAVSTFRTWDSFARAYASVFLPHAKVTPSIAAMATRLTQGMMEPSDQARAIYEWVRDHIRYIPVPLEESRPDPHDADQVLASLYGDDKDVVVLLHALLAARDIPAEIVLLNASVDGTIADPPNIRPMNHLILFLPGLDTYVDATLGVAPFGVLAFSELGKPAIHLDTASAPARRDIPFPSSGDTSADMKTEITLAANGDAAGTTTTTGRGAFGVWLRGDALAMGENNTGAAVSLLRQHGTPGTGTFSFGPPTAPGDDYTVRGTFQLENQSALLHGGYFVLWTGLRLLPRPGDFLAGPMFPEDSRLSAPTFCYRGTQDESLSIILPEGREIGSVPPDVAIDTELVRYRSHWTLNGQRVTVTREFGSLASKLICDGPTRDAMAEVLAKIRRDMVTPVGIKQDGLATPTSTGDSADPGQ
jgi:hypothetical protein